MLSELHEGNKKEAPDLIIKLKEKAIQNQNIFESLMEVTKMCSLGEITNALFDVGGQYRRNM